MNAPREVLVEQLVHRLGWALAHSLWQGAAVAVAVAVLMVLLRGCAAAIRYYVALTALFGIVAAVVVTAYRCDVSNTRSADVPSASPAVGDSSLGLQAARVGGLSSAPSDAEGGAGADFGFVVSSRHSSWIVSLWLAGVGLLGTWRTAAWWQLHPLCRRDVSKAPGWFEAALRSVAGRMNLQRGIRLLESGRIAVPVVMGALRPALLFPAGMLTGLTIRELEAILAHELAHVKRRDYLVNLLQTFVETLFFYHPAVWWLSCRVRAERENCCDDLAIGACGDRRTLAHALLRLEESRAGREPPGLAAAAGGNGSLLTRLRRILDKPSPRTRRERLAAAGQCCAGGLTAAALMWLAPLALHLESPLATAVFAGVPQPSHRQKETVPAAESIASLEQIDILHDTPIAEFLEGATLPLGNGYHVFDQVPSWLAGRRYTKRNGYQGLLRFRVREEQTVTIAVYGSEWGGGGNHSGGWRQQVVSPEGLAEQGWQQVDRLIGRDPTRQNAETAWIVYSRFCRAGESFAIRTHKYQAPVLFSRAKVIGGES